MRFGKYILIVLSFAFFVSCFSGKSGNKKEGKEFYEFISYAGRNRLDTLEKGSQMVSIAEYFIDTPYVPGTLEINDREKLVVNLKQFDCMTFVENVLALYKTINTKPDFSNFKSCLENIRYRKGHLDRYLSRLHYTSEWIEDNVKKGNVSLVDLGDSAGDFDINVYFMSHNSHLYKAIKGNKQNIDSIAGIEKRLNALTYKYIPESNFECCPSFLQDGDIIIFTTKIPGLDFSHLGIAVKGKDGCFHFIHASSDHGKVVLSEKSIAEYMIGLKRHSGLLVLRAGDFNSKH